MANNISLNTLGGALTFATDDVSSVHYHVIKQAFGADDTATWVSTANPLPVQSVGASATVSSVDASEVAATLAAAASRRGLIIKNDSPQRLYLKYGSGADPATSFTDWVEPGATWVMSSPLYTGLVSGVWLPPELQFSSQSNFGAGAVSGRAFVTETTA